MIVKWTILHNEYSKYIHILILLYFYLSNILIARLLLVTEYSHTVVLLLLLKYMICILLPPLSNCFLRHSTPQTLPPLTLCATHS